MLSLTNRGPANIHPEDIELLRDEFSTKHCIYLKNFITKDLLHGIVDDIAQATFTENQHYDKDNYVFASDLSISGKNLTLHKITFLLNNTNLFRLVEQITGCTEIKGFAGRIYKNMPNQSHHLDWHDDTEDQSRLVAISINLSANVYEGGKFQIREKASQKITREISGGRLGDAHIFRVSPLLEHCVTKTTGDFPRIAAAGWFVNSTNSPYLTNK